MIRLLPLLLLLTLVFLPREARAQKGPFGIGFVIGEPTALSAKYWVSEVNALDFAVGWNNDDDGYWDDEDWCKDDGRRFRCDEDWDDGYFHFHVDYLWHKFGLFGGRERIPLYFGPGLLFQSEIDDDDDRWEDDDDDFFMGIRGLFGVAWLPRGAPLEIFFEIGPAIGIFPVTESAFTAGVGMRFYF